LLEFNRPNQISPTLLLLDGISGTGKTMVSSLLDSLEGTTAPIFDYTFEQLLIMRNFEKISTETFQTVLSLHLDQRLYDNSISREVNLRIKDLSSILRSPKKWTYLRNLFLNDAKFNFENTRNHKDRKSTRLNSSHAILKQ